MPLTRLNDISNEILKERLSLLNFDEVDLISLNPWEREIEVVVEEEEKKKEEEKGGKKSCGMLFSFSALLSMRLSVFRYNDKDSDCS